jgi:hypothetical protein
MTHNTNDIILKRIRYLIPDLNDTSKYGAHNAKIRRHLIVLYIATIYPSFCNAAEIDNANNLRYFSGPLLQKVVKTVAKDWDTDRIKFNRPKSDEAYESCQNKGYVKIKRKAGNRKLFALTNEGIKHCQEIVNLTYNPLIDPMAAKSDQTSKSMIIDDLLSFGQYCRRRDVQSTMSKYPIFVGRTEEKEVLNSFLKNHAQSIMLITGDGGTGKTRLILEFIKNLETDSSHKPLHEVYFVNPDRERFSPSLSNNTLLILDDASKFANLNSVIDLILNSDNSTGSKLILIERAIFKDHILNMIRQKNVKPDELNLERGYIIDFLKQNFSLLDEHVAKDIEIECRGSFDYAAICAEYYLSGGNISRLADILSWKTERYIKDIAMRTKSDIADVKYIIHLFSIITPIDWVKDRNRFMEDFPDLYDTMEKILYGARNIYEDSIIISENHSIYLIKPDPLADLFRLHALRNRKLVNALSNLISHAPFRIAHNIISTTDIREQDTRESRLIFKIWDALNDSIENGPEFIKAVEYFTGTVRFYFGPELINSRAPNLDKWLKCFEKIYNQNSENFAIMRDALIYLCDHYRVERNFKLFDSSLYYLDSIIKKYKVPEDNENELIQGILIGRFLHSNHSPQPDILDGYLLKLETLYTKYPSKLNLSYARLILEAFREHLAGDIVGEPSLLYRYIEKLCELYEKHETNEIGELLINAFALSIMLFSRYRLLEYVIKDIKEMRNLYDKLRNEGKRAKLVRRDCIGLALSVANDLWKRDYNVQVLNQDFEAILNIYTEFIIFEDMFLFTYEGADFVDYQIHKTEDGLFLIVVSDSNLPAIDLENNLTVEDTSLGGHMLLYIREKEIKLMICPVRLYADDMLRAMIQDILHQRFSKFWLFDTNEAKIGITNKKGLAILQNSTLDSSQKNRLMHQEKCTVHIFTSKFLSMSLAYALVSIHQSNGRLFTQCSYCSSKGLV